MLRPPALLHWFPELRNYCDAAMALAASISRGSFKRLQQRPRGERLCEIDEAPGLMRSHADGGAVVPSHEDDWNRIAIRLETVPQLEA
jgi:hypothetical protein